MKRANSGNRRAFWLKQVHYWHWVSSAMCLAGMLLFAITGITLNHASTIEARPEVTARQAMLPAELLAVAASGRAEGKAPLPAALGEWLAAELAVRAQGREAEWSDGEIYIALPQPGGDAWVSIDRTTGEVLYERTDRGWISYLNDLHKGRNTGPAWAWFIDVFAGACLVFALTGLFLLQLHAAKRPTTWPLVGIGVAVPVGLAILFIH